MITKREKLLAAMAEEPEKVFTSKELKELLNIDECENHYNYLYKVLKSREIDRVAVGKYRINSVGLATLERLRNVESIVPEI